MKAKKHGVCVHCRPLPEGGDFGSCVVTGYGVDMLEPTTCPAFTTKAVQIARKRLIRATRAFLMATDVFLAYRTPETRAGLDKAKSAVDAALKIVVPR